jgi:hypothetical protein
VSVHEDLRTLVTGHGERVLHAPDDLRAALAEVIEAGQGSPAEMDLLVDAVRLGAYRQLLSLLAQRAEPRAAVEGAAAHLVANRGGDQRGAGWACATLGYAVGRVPEAVVLSFRSQPSSRDSVATPPASPAAGRRRPAHDADRRRSRCRSPGSGRRRGGGGPGERGRAARS